MTGPGAREVGFPWFDRHATKGPNEIFTYSRDVHGVPCRPRYLGCVWRSQDDMRAFYARGFQQSAARSPGFVDYKDFDSWEEAERWLMAE